MWWLSGIVVAFVLAVVGVGVLGRSATARWERDQSAARARRRSAVPPPEERPGTAVRLRGAMVRAAAPVAGAVRTRLTVPARVLTRARLTVPARVLTRARTKARRRIRRTPVPGRRLVPRVRDALRAAAAGHGVSLRRRRTAKAGRSGARTGGRRRARIAAPARIEPPGDGSPPVGPLATSGQPESTAPGTGARLPGGGSDE